MNIYDKINSLKEELDKDCDIIKIKEIQNKILEDKKLLEDIKDKNNIDNNDLIIEYKHLENLINYKILSINKELREIRGDKDENNSR